MKEFLHDIDRVADAADPRSAWGKPGYELASANGYQHIIAPPELFDGEPARFPVIRQDASGAKR